MLTKIIEIYNHNLRIYNYQRAEINRKRKIVSVLRVILFVGFVVFFIYNFKVAPKYSFYSFFPFAAAFIALIKVSNKLKEKRRHLIQLIDINSRETEAMQEEFCSFDGGKEFADHQHPYTSDLDLFGEGSLFQLINRTCSASGKVKLASWLKSPKTKKAEIELIQESVRELSSNLEWRQGFEATGRCARESVEEKEALLDWLQGEVYFNNKKYLKVLGIVLPVLTMVALVLGVFSEVSLLWFYSLFFLQLAVIALHLKKINAKHSQLGRKFMIVGKYSKLLEYVEREHFQSTYLKGQKEALLHKGKNPSQHVKELAKIIENLDQRFNVIAAIFLNGMFFWDVNYVLKLEKWQENFKHELPGWINTISEFDALASLGGFAYNNFDFTYPLADDSSFVIEAKGLGHPLLKRQERITNDFHIEKFSQIIVLTGANMAGKSTFLRSVGINMVLAMVGAPVNASQCTFYPIKLYTSLRTNDSLQKHESFFYAELKKLKLIIKKYESGEEVFILLDEILKGTNSRDQHLGSESLIKKLLRLNGVGIMATHDIELANLENLFPQQVKNYCFEIKMDLDRLIFDYKIKAGYCKVMNASILMRQSGIID